MNDFGLRYINLPHLIDALRSTGASLKTLNIGSLQLGPPGSAVLGAYISGNLRSTLSKLAIEGCDVRDKGFISLLPYLAQCYSLRILDISANGLTEVGLQALVNSPLPGLTQLVVTDNIIDEGLLSDLKAAHPNTEIIDEPEEAEE
mmetsp:Transcript_16213/g.46593  ORF Transcript_16213/g.46593 Transcript_16213/m.46593 type:complete len:146 (-) Transcript_16213:114-551(-)